MLILYYVGARRFFTEMGVEQLFEINCQEFVCVSLLAYDVRPPDFRKRLNDMKRLCSFFFLDSLNVLHVSA